MTSPDRWIEDRQNVRDARLVVRTAAGETLTRERRDFAFADRINALDTLDDVGEVTSLLRA